MFGFTLVSNIKGLTVRTQIFVKFCGVLLKYLSWINADYFSTNAWFDCQIINAIMTLNLIDELRTDIMQHNAQIKTI